MIHKWYILSINARISIPLHMAISRFTSCAHCNEPRSVAYNSFCFRTKLILMFHIWSPINTIKIISNNEWNHETVSLGFSEMDLIWLSYMWFNSCQFFAMIYYLYLKTSKDQIKSISEKVNLLLLVTFSEKDFRDISCVNRVVLAPNIPPSLFNQSCNQKSKCAIIIFVVKNFPILFSLTIIFITDMRFKKYYGLD